MFKKVFGVLAIVSLMATIAVGVAVNSSDHLALTLPGNYTIQVNTRYVGSTKMRSFALLKGVALADESESGCVSDATAKASQSMIDESESGCVSDATAKASQSMIEEESGCVSDATAKASQSMIEEESGCVSDATAKASQSMIEESESGCVSDATARASQVAVTDATTRVLSFLF